MFYPSVEALIGLEQISGMGYFDVIHAVFFAI